LHFSALHTHLTSRLSTLHAEGGLSLSELSLLSGGSLPRLFCGDADSTSLRSKITCDLLG
jgi:hypothetical protein